MLLIYNLEVKLFMKQIQWDRKSIPNIKMYKYFKTTIKTHISSTIHVKQA